MLKQPITFHTYCGLAGELDLLLIGETSDGRRASRLFLRVGPFKWLSFFWAMFRVVRELNRCSSCCKTHLPLS